MDTTTIMVILAVVAVLAIIVAFTIQRRRSAKLRERYGAEYSRAVVEAGGRRKGEAELAGREKRMEAFSIRPLSILDRERYVGSWRIVQEEFVDDPAKAVLHADQLVEDVMSAQGYPMTDFEQAAADLSVDHPVVVQNYRAAHEIVRRRRESRIGTEDLRQAMIHYRTLFDELVDQGSGSVATA
ncbi:hypothetical protein [Phenylobacterium montanum]|uniref:Secreted protein n=1 Tax=Phenylobacterium montanum TaxID=2823693 RepID=A0A975G1N9_9CAUL|nr:hypothetical protein [Caulobacter sp. S6]QUD89245.1 hypothetical protein KCG34_05020 [Caulobacter sp. S6]